ncbi:MAG: S1 RNA-binding domain-containing protein [Bacteroidota bacterium]
MPGNKHTDQVEIDKGNRLKGTVIKVEPFGVFLDIEQNFDGLILAPHLTSNPHKPLEDYPNVGEELEAIVIDFQDDGEIEHRYVSLSILEKHFLKYKE